MRAIKTVEALETLYGPASSKSLDKVVREVTPLYRRWIEASRFLVLTTVGPEGTDGSPRGDDSPAVAVLDGKTLLLPDWRGNNRLDSLRNIIRDPRVSLMFMVPGSDNVVRVNGTAILTDDADLAARFDKSGKRPKTVIVVTVNELYFQCAKALMRSRLWASEDEGTGLPTAGDFIKAFKEDFAGREYDETYPDYARSRMW